MRKVILHIIVFLVAIATAIAQPRVVGLTEKDRIKINEQSSIEKRSKLYTKLLHKDSVRFMKESNRYWQGKLDSIHGEMSGRTKKLKEKREKLAQKIQDPLRKLPARLQISEEDYRFPPELERKYTRKELDAIYATMRYYLVETAKDTLHLLKGKFAVPSSIASWGSELKNKAGANVPSVNNPVSGLKGKATSELRGKLGQNEALGDVKELTGDAKGYMADYKKYSQYGDLSVDSAKQLALQYAEKEAQNKLIALGGLKDQQSQLSQFNELKKLQDQYKPQMDQLQDSAARREMAKKKAEELATKYLEDNPSALKAAQRKMEMLMKKYSFVPNSNDLSTAVKRTSLKGKSFRERLVIATNFQLLSIDPVAIDFSPQVGYKFNTRLAAGVGMMYRQTFSDTIPVISPTVFGYKGFVSYDVIKSFFAYGEFAQNSPGIEVREGISKRIWKPAAILGIGRKFAVHKKIDMTVTALYNFLYRYPDPVYPRAFFVRVGFQLSNIALVKKKPELKW